jgi:hypothetical protein
MVRLTEEDLKAFQQAIYKDYGVLLPDEVLYQQAFNLLQFIDSLIKFDKEDKEKAKKQTTNNSEVLKASLPLS